MLHKKFLLCCAFPLLSEPAKAETAIDITHECTLTPGSNRKSLKKCMDRNYKSYWQSNSGKGAKIDVQAKEPVSGVYLQWYERPHAWAVQLQQADGSWVEYSHTSGEYLAEYLPLPEGTTAFRITNAKGSNRFLLAELRVYGMGSLPPEVQCWNAPATKADLMLVVAHPDDEVLWFGGTLPTYAGEMGKTCQVCMMVPTLPCRRLELLDSLWCCGVRNYPVWGGFKDSFSGSLSAQYKHWKKDRVYELITGWIRRFKPDVLLTHDFSGEYGHGAHRVCADAVSHCLNIAANPKKYTDSAKAYGTWDVPKCYIHLYDQNVIHMDWRVPLESFGGLTGFEVAQDAFLCHVSQQKTDYVVQDFGPYDNSLFGLYRSLVGPDEKKNDFFEHIPVQDGTANEAAVDVSDEVSDDVTGDTL